mgnify:CR=1 FL=1
MENAIKSAIRGGYKTPKSKFNGVQTDVVLQEVVLLDPLFWQALGKAEGWDKQGRYAMTHWSCDGILDTRPWFNIMMNFMSQVIGEGKDINTFFEELLSKSLTTLNIRNIK